MEGSGRGGGGGNPGWGQNFGQKDYEKWPLTPPKDLGTFCIAKSGEGQSASAHMQ